MRTALLMLIAATALPAQVTYERILNTGEEPHNWLTYSGNYSSHRHSSLDQINRESVGDLRTLWTHQIETLHKFETTPIVVDGIMFITEPPSDVTALDARTGRTLWAYKHQMPNDVPVCCGQVNRGVAVLGDTIYIGTLDARLIALDAKSGFVRWNIEVTDYKIGQSLTGAPLALDGKVVVGMAGGEFGVRGFLDAYDAATGKRLWRFWTVPGPGEPGNETWAGDSWKHGSATTWVTGSYDPELNLIYWGTGNPGPDWNGDVREGDNLYSDSLIAVDADTGKLKWYFQFTPHDVHDWDSTAVPILMDGVVYGRERKLVLFANRNGFYYVLDRTSGEFLVGKAYVKQTWAEALDDSGRPIRIPNMSPTFEGIKVYPSVFGATNWYSPSYSPTDHLFYVTATEGGHIFLKGEAVYEAGSRYAAGGFHNVPGEETLSAVRAFEPETGQLKWEFPLHQRAFGGLLSTAGGLVFGSSAEGDIFALNSSDGTPLWNFRSGGRMYSNPISYSVDGQQHVAFAAGHAIFVFSLDE
jgi:alcohol dehydrogenase (cytochrome c)